jgi:MoaA/NifB/PqqE/SkfB family radical SAM enzyme
MTAYLYVTLRCNARCGFCSIWRNQAGAPPDLPAELGIKLLRDLKRLGVRHVDFTGGEPLLYPHLPELLSYARKAGLFTSITSNGLMYLERASELKGLPDSLGFSLNGPSAEIHDRVQGVPSFERTLASIRLALELGEPVHAHFTATDRSIEYLEPTLELAQRTGVPLIVYPEFSYFGNCQLSPEHLAKMRSLSREKGACINTACLKFAEHGGNKKEKPLCSAGRSALAIAPDGSILLPCFHMQRASIPTGGDLYATYRRQDTQHLIKESGRYPFCDGCTNWCYINPSFVFPPSGYTTLHLRSAVRALRGVYREKWLSKAADILISKPIRRRSSTE